MSRTIGLFTDTYLPQINGVTTLMPIMERLFREQGHKVYVFAPSYDKPRWSRESEHIFRFPAFKFAFHKDSRITLPFHKEARSIFRELDIVHSQTPFSLGVLGIRLSRKYQIPHLHTYHTLFTEYLHYFPKYLRPSPKIVGKVSVAFCDRCDAVTVPSTPMKEELISYGVKVPVHTLPFGLDMNDFAGEPKVNLREQLNIAEDEKILLCTGRLSHEKNVEFVIESFAKIQAEIPKSKLIIVGDGPARKDFEISAAELNVAEKVIFTGFVQWQDIIDYYKQADLFVYGSKTETQGIVYMEAMASGLPAIAVGEMGALEAIRDGETGYLVKEDVTAFSDAALKLLGDSELHAEFSKNAMAFAEEMSMQSTLSQLEDIYDEMLNARMAIGQM
jgi:1,2-diacylglycerol 3-alpha-glucosyltransferase